jgi:hypothetical protein
MSRFAHLRRREKFLKNCFLYMMYFVKIDQLGYPDMTTALQTCYNINADWRTFFLEAIAFPLFSG